MFYVSIPRIITRTCKDLSVTHRSRGTMRLFPRGVFPGGVLRVFPGGVFPGGPFGVFPI